MIDIIKEYMVSLGVDIDEKGFTDFKKTLQSSDKEVSSFVTNFGKNFIKAGGIVATALTAATTATTAIITKTAQADLQYAKLARTLWTTKENAKSMQIVLDAMGQSKEDVMWIPELNKEYRELAALGNQMKAPTELSDQLKMIRGIGFEFTRLKLEATYALEWISYYLIKYLGEPLEKTKKSWSEFNDKIVKEMPRWTQAIAFGLSFLVKAGLAVVRMVTTLWDRLSKFWDSLPSGFRKAVMAISALAAVIMSGPLGWIVAGLSTVLLLLEDFFGYLDGKESSQTLAPIWGKVVKVLETLDGWLKKLSYAINEVYELFEESGSLRDYLELLKELSFVVYELASYLLNGLVWGIKELYKYLDENGTIDRYKDSLIDLWEGFIELGKGIANVFRETKKWFEYVSRQTSFMRFWEGLKKALKGVLDIASTVVSTIGGIGKVVGLLLQGKWAEAGKAALSLGAKTASGFFGGAADIHKGGWGMLSGGSGMIGDGFRYLSGTGNYSLKNGYELEGVKPETLAALDFAAQAYKQIFGHEVMVTAGTNGSHAGGTHSHGNGWKVDITDDWSNDSMANDQEKRKQFIQLLESAGISVGDEYVDTNGVNWTGGHLDLSAQNFRPPASAFDTSNTQYGSINVGDIHIHPPEGSTATEIASTTLTTILNVGRGTKTFEELRKNRVMAGVYT